MPYYFILLNTTNVLNKPVLIAFILEKVITTFIYIINIIRNYLVLYNVITSIIRRYVHVYRLVGVNNCLSYTFWL
jgi:hypothetical protein